MSSVTSTSSSSGVSRYWGLASGLDVDSIVTALVSDEQEKIDKVKQQQQTLQWQQSAYQTIIADMQAFQDAYLSITGSSSMSKSTAYTTYVASSGSSVITAKATSSATSAEQDVTVVQSATTASITGVSIHNGEASLTLTADQLSSLSGDLSFTVNVDGTSKTITLSKSQLENDTDTSTNTNSDLTAALESNFGTVVDTTNLSNSIDKVTATVTKDSSGNYTINFNSASGYESSVSASVADSTSSSSLSGGSNRLDTSEDLSTLLNLTGTAADNDVYVKINNTTVDLGKASSTTLSSAMATLNASGAGITMTYNSTSDVMSIISNTSGSASTLTPDTTDGTIYTDSTDTTSVTNSTAALFSALGLTGTTSYSGTLASGITDAETSTETLADLFGVGTSEAVSVTINGKSISLGTGSTTLADAINNFTSYASSAGITAQYSSRELTLSSSSSSAITVGSDANTQNFLSLFSLAGAAPAVTTGQDAIVNINGSYYSRSSNNFTINGVTYTINKNVTTAESTANPSNYSSAVTMTQDTSTLETNVKNFVTAYNNLITTIYNYTNTKPDSDYQPLTDAQKADMTSDQITAWNTKAQQGILFDDSTLQDIADQLRTALYQSVTLSDGKSVSLYNFGITTSDDPDDHGTLVIDQNGGTDFEDALANNLSEFQEYFTKTSTTAFDLAPQNGEESGLQFSGYTDPTTGTFTVGRFASEGLIAKLSDIIERASGSDGNAYGSLLTIAGSTSGTTQYSNYIYSELQELSSRITDLNTEMSDKKNLLYSKFQALETFMQEANAESSTLTSMLSGG